MNAENAHKIILITGINGYIASHIALQLLKKGYSVRGTSRSASAAQRLVSPDGGPFHPYHAQFQHMVVPDITVPSAFDDAVKGVYSIIHTASPVDFSLKSVDEFFIPAIQGNISILNSAKSHTGHLASFVLTSSIAAVVDKWKHSSPGHIYTEGDWNTSGEAVARENFTAPVAYGASKAAAERALWEWVSKNKPSFACAAINPSVVTGPPILWPDSPAALNETLKPVWQIYANEADTLPPQIGGAAYVDVRDVAAVHVFAALSPEKSNGQRYLTTNGKAPPQAIADILRAHYPDRKIIEGTPGEGYIPGTFWFKEDAAEGLPIATKAYQALGVKEGGFIKYDKSVLDTVQAMEQRWPGKATNLK